MPCECHNSDAEHEVALANTKHLEHLRGFIREVFALPSVQQAVYDVEANQMADTIEAMIEEGIAL